MKRRLTWAAAWVLLGSICWAISAGQLSVVVCYSAALAQLLVAGVQWRTQRRSTGKVVKH